MGLHYTQRAMPTVRITKKSINKTQGVKAKEQPLFDKQTGRLCLCVVHIKELLREEFDDVILNFPTRALEDEPDNIKYNIPKSCYSINEITHFYYTKIGIVKLSSKIQMMQNLRLLDLRHNNLVKIPDSLQKTNIQEINLQHNRLIECPLFPETI